MKNNRPKTARAVKANPGIRVWYRKQIESLVDRLRDSISWWIPAAYKKGANAILLQKAIDELRDQWTATFNDRADWIASRFLKRVDSTSRNAIKRSLAEVGFNVDWSKDKTVNNVLNSVKQTQVDLIKTIPQEALDRVSGIVQRGVQDGRDIHYIQKELEHGFGITKRRAKTIAIDQTQKATSAINRARYIQAGIKEAVWVHVAGRKTSRPTHVAMHNKTFKLDGQDAGMYDSAVKERVMPGQLINCRCSCRAILPANFFDL